MRARWQAEPPRGITPARLWRLLAAPSGRPTLAIPLRLSFAPNVPLSVQGLTGHELAEALDREETGGHDETTSALVAAALLADGRRAFRASGELGNLYPSEFAALTGAVLRALETVSPYQALADNAAWGATLGEGCTAPANLSIAASAADCYDLAAGGTAYWRIPRPDRYYGRPTCALTDGQIMAYRAAFERIWQLRGGNDNG